MRKLDRTGEVKYNTNGAKMIICAYRNCDDMDILFEEYNWIYKGARYWTFSKGEIRCPYDRTVHGMGYLGEGEYSAMNGDNMAYEYRVWNDMLNRCYNKKYKEKHPTYKDCFVCDDWHNFQNFAKWFKENYYEINEEQMNLDKDILFKGNKMYSPETCVFVPQNINKLFLKSDGSRGEYPIGVSYHRFHKLFCAKCQNQHGVLVHLGYFNEPIEPFLKYKKYKEKLIKKVADENKELIPTKLYEAMFNYIVEITD